MAVVSGAVILSAIIVYKARTFKDPDVSDYESHNIQSEAGIQNEAYTSDDYQEDKKVLNGAIHDLNVGHKTIEEFQPQPSTSNGLNGLGIAVISTNQLSSQPSAFNRNFDNSRL